MDEKRNEGDGRLTAVATLKAPHVLACCLGMACALCVRDLYQFVLSDVIWVSYRSQYAVAVGRALALTVLLVALALSQHCKTRSTGTTASGALGVGAASLGALLEFAGLLVEVFAPMAASMGYLVLGMGQSLLIGAWALWFFHLRKREAFVACMASFALAGVLEALACTLGDVGLAALVLAAPLVSLLLYASMRSRLPEAQTPCAAPAKKGPRALLSLLTFLAYSFIARQLLDTWIANSAGTPDPLAQLFAAGGALLASLIVYLAFRLRASFKQPAIYTVFVAFVVCLALYLSTALNGALGLFGLVPLFALRKALLFLALFYARERAGCAERLEAFCWAMLLVELGNLGQTAFFRGVEACGLDEAAVGSVVMVVLLVYVVAVEWSSFYRMHAVEVLRDEETPHDDMTSQIERAMARMSEDCGLTARETQVLACLAMGRNADYVSRTLGIAVSTAKSHIAHIYRKTGFNSQQRLMDALTEGHDANPPTPRI